MSWALGTVGQSGHIGSSRRRRLELVVGGRPGVTDPLRSGRVAELVEGHLRDLAWRNYSPDTIYQTRRALTRFALWLNHGTIEEASTDDIRNFLDRPTRAKQPRTPATRVAELSRLAGFYRWMAIEGHRVDEPTLPIARPKLPRWLPRPIDEEPLELALREAPERIRPWLYLAAYEGLRACEIAPLRAEHLHWGAEPVIEVVRGKGGDARMVAMAPVIERELRRLPRRGWLFPRLDGEPGPVKPHLVSHLANRYLHGIGINDTLHSLRHRFGTQFYKASGRDLRLTQEAMGHKSVVSTQGYTLVDKSEEHGVVAQLPGASGRVSDNGVGSAAD